VSDEIETWPEVSYKEPLPTAVETAHLLQLDRRLSELEAVGFAYRPATIIEPKPKNDNKKALAMYGVFLIILIGMTRHYQKKIVDGSMNRKEKS
jgi:hypothetical protein